MITISQEEFNIVMAGKDTLHIICQRRIEELLTMLKEYNDQLQDLSKRYYQQDKANCEFRIEQAEEISRLRKQIKKVKETK